MRYFEISAKSNYHFEMPFLSLARSLLNEPQLQFTVAPALMPPEPGFEFDQAEMDNYNQELEAASNIQLPDDENDFMN